MQNKTARFLWIILLGTVANIESMEGPPPGIITRPVSMAFKKGAKALGNGLTLRKTVPQPLSKSPETPSTIQFANGHLPKVSQPKDNIFGPLPPPPEGYDFGEERSPDQPPFFGDRPWQLEEQPYAMASDICPEEGFEYANARDGGGIPVPAITISGSHSAPSSPPKEEGEPPSLRKTVSDGADKKTKSKRRVSIAVKGTLRGLKHASSLLPMRHEPPPSDKKKKRSSSATKFIVKKLTLDEPSQPNKEGEVYGNATLVSPAAEPEEEEQYGNDPRSFTEQLKERLREDNPSIPQLMRLIGDGADPSAKGKEGKTPLHLLAEMGNEGGIKYLCESGDIRIDLNVPNDSGETPFTSAIKAQKIGAAAELLQYGAVLPPFTDSKGNSLFHVAASEGSKCLAEQLLTAKATDMNSQNNVGQTPLHYAILHNQAGMAIWLIKRNVTLLPDQHGKEPLDYAVPRGSCPIIAALLQRDEYPLEMRQRLAQKTRNERIRKLLLQTRTQTTEPVYAELGAFEEKST